ISLMLKFCGYNPILSIPPLNASEIAFFIMLCVAFRYAIDEYLKVRLHTTKKYLFTTKIGKMRYDYFRSLCERISLKAEVKFHLHMARHTYATELLKKELSVYYVALLLGIETCLVRRSICIHLKMTP
ncbi:MAG: site-specific integrase, partial [Thermoplasmata archaeon]